MNRLASRMLGLRRVANQVRNHGHEVAHNPGPPCTMDMSPVPFQPYKKVYGELNAKFNTMLAVSVTLFVASIGAAIYQDVFIAEAMRPPMSYRERK